MSFARFDEDARKLLTEVYKLAREDGEKEISLEHFRRALKAADGEDAQATEGTGSSDS